MASGVIYLIIIGMWVAYFLPRWMRQHETQSGRETERYKSAMKKVASTPNFPDQVNPEVKSKIQRRRRVVLSSLLAIVLVTSLLAAVGVIPIVGILIPITGTCIYVVHVRRQVVAAQIKKRRLAALAAITTAQIKINPEARIDLSRRERSESEAILEQWVPLQERPESNSITIITRQEKVERQRKAAEAAAATWSPVDVPRPTYATAPKAITPKRTIDLTTPGKWSAEQERLKALEIPSHDELFDQEVAEQAASRDWASNQ